VEIVTSVVLFPKNGLQKQGQDPNSAFLAAQTR